jgi:hypothetical protein
MCTHDIRRCEMLGLELEWPGKCCACMWSAPAIILNSGLVCCAQLGDGTNTDRNTPSADVLTSVAAITAGAWHTCALTASGGVTCWGYNGYFQASAVHARGIPASALNSDHVCCCAAWRWYKHGSKHAICRCADKCGSNYCWSRSYMCTHNIRRCEMLGSE